MEEEEPTSEEDNLADENAFEVDISSRGSNPELASIKRSWREGLVQPTSLLAGTPRSWRAGSDASGVSKWDSLVAIAPRRGQVGSHLARSQLLHPTPR